jgi:Asp/Glu/hydantoin racemase
VAVTLPKFEPQRRSIDVDGEVVLIRSLTRREVAQGQQLSSGEDWTELEVFVISCGTDTPLEETREWYSKAPNHVPGVISSAIRELSRLDEEAQKSS